MKYFLIALILSTASATACSFDTDCNVGSQCVKSGYDLYGVCMGGMNPGNSYDQRPVYNQFDLNSSDGNTCHYDMDCGIGRRCMKSGYQLNGVCM